MSEKKEIAVIRSGAKQHTVSVGQRLWVEKLAVKTGDEVSFDEVLLVDNGQGTLRVGTPHVAGATVKARVFGTKKDAKIRIFKKQRRTGYTKRQGHRQQRVGLVIESINI